MTARYMNFSGPRPVCRPSIGGLLLFWGFESPVDDTVPARITAPSCSVPCHAIRVENIVQACKCLQRLGLRV
jgi:hypothetical protein